VADSLLAVSTLGFELPLETLQIRPANLVSRKFAPELTPERHGYPGHGGGGVGVGVEVGVEATTQDNSFDLALPGTPVPLSVKTTEK
jgi:hypothetical protein